MYYIKHQEQTVLTRETETEAYDAAMELASIHLAETFKIYKDKEEIAKFMVLDKPADSIWTDQAIRILNGGPLKGAIGKYVLEALDETACKWYEIH